LVLICWLSLALLQATPDPFVVAAQSTEERETVIVDTIHVDGLIYTRPEVIVRLLPRAVPGTFTRFEIEEFERRVRNLSLFDQVLVMRDARTLKVAIREKITLAPILDLTTGSSLKDLNATVGVVEYNLGGTATQLGGQFNYS
jgi:outer membrane protein assembly factor BamA